MTSAEAGGSGAIEHWVEGPSDGFMNDDGSYGRTQPDFDHDMPYNTEERLRTAEAEVKRLKDDNYRARAEWFQANEARVAADAQNARLRANNEKLRAELRGFICEECLKPLGNAKDDQ